MDNIGLKKISIQNCLIKVLKKIDFKKYSNKKVKLSVYDYRADFTKVILNHLLYDYFKNNDITQVHDKEIKKKEKTITVPVDCDVELNFKILISGTYYNRGMLYDECKSIVKIKLEETVKNKNKNLNEYMSFYSYKYNILTNYFSIFIYSFIFVFIILYYIYKLKLLKK